MRTSCHYAKFVMSFYILELWPVCYLGSCNWFVVTMEPGTSVNYLYDVDSVVHVNDIVPVLMRRSHLFTANSLAYTEDS